MFPRRPQTPRGGASSKPASHISRRLATRVVAKSRSIGPIGAELESILELEFVWKASAFDWTDCRWENAFDLRVNRCERRRGHKPVWFLRVRGTSRGSVDGTDRLSLFLVCSVVPLGSAVFIASVERLQGFSAVRILQFGRRRRRQRTMTGSHSKAFSTSVGKSSKLRLNVV